MSTSISMGKLLGFVSIKSRIFNCSFKLYLNISKNISPAVKIIFEAKAAWQMLKFYCKYSLLIRNITANLTFKFLNVRFTLFLRWLFSCEKKHTFPASTRSISQCWTIGCINIIILLEMKISPTPTMLRSDNVAMLWQLNTKVNSTKS